MSDCGCTGEFHNGGCSDVNVIFWHGVPGGHIPVNPTDEQLTDQLKRNLVRSRLHERDLPGIVLADGAEWPQLILPP